MELDTGRCLFGHNPKGLSKNYKNSISRGLYVALPSSIHARTAKIIAALFPQYQVVILPDRAQAISLLADEIGAELRSDVFSLFNARIPYSKTGGTGYISLWRPFAESENTDIILPIIPQPGYTAPQIILFRQDSGFHPRNIPLCSLIFLHGLYHVLMLLQRAFHYGSLNSVAKMEHQPGKHRESLGITRHWFSEEQWSRFLPPSSTVWERRGPYVYANEVGRESLKNSWNVLQSEHSGLRLPMHAERVIILPSLASYGEQKLIRTFFNRTEEVLRENRT